MCDEVCGRSKQSCEGKGIGMSGEEKIILNFVLRQETVDAASPAGAFASGGACGGLLPPGKGE